MQNLYPAPFSTKMEIPVKVVCGKIAFVVAITHDNLIIAVFTVTSKSDIIFSAPFLLCRVPLKVRR